MQRFMSFLKFVSITYSILITNGQTLSKSSTQKREGSLEKNKAFYNLYK